MTQKSGSVFAPGPVKTLYRGDLLVGEADAFRFQGREVHVQTALCWDFDQEALKSVEMRDGSGVYIDTRYSTIVNRSLDGTVPWKVQLWILDTPDYFEYTVSET